MIETERLERAAAAALTGLLASGLYTRNGQNAVTVAREAVRCAHALIAEVDAALEQPKPLPGQLRHGAQWTT